MDRIAETGREAVSGNNENITNAADSLSISLSTTYDEPVVVAHTATDSGDQPVEDRVTDVSSNSFTLFAHKPDNEIHNDNTHTYIVVEQGVWNTPEENVIEAGIHQTETTTRANESFNGDYVDFENDWSQTPVVLATVNTHNNGTFSTAAIQNVTSDGFYLSQLTENGQPTEIEKIGWVAFPPMVTSLDGNLFEAGFTDAESITWTSSFPNKPDYIADWNSYSGTDPRWVRGSATWSATDAGWYLESGSNASGYGYVAIEDLATIRGRPLLSDESGTFTYKGQGETHDPSTGYSSQTESTGGDYSGTIKSNSSVEEHPDVSVTAVSSLSSNPGTTTTETAPKTETVALNAFGSVATTAHIVANVEGANATSFSANSATAESSISIGDGILATVKRASASNSATADASSTTANSSTLTGGDTGLESTVTGDAEITSFEANTFGSEIASSESSTIEKTTFTSSKGSSTAYSDAGGIVEVTPISNISSVKASTSDGAVISSEVDSTDVLTSTFSSDGGKSGATTADSVAEPRTALTDGGVVASTASNGEVGVYTEKISTASPGSAEVAELESNSEIEARSGKAKGEISFSEPQITLAYIGGGVQSVGIEARVPSVATKTESGGEIVGSNSNEIQAGINTASTSLVVTDGAYAISTATNPSTETIASSDFQEASISTFGDGNSDTDSAGSIAEVAISTEESSSSSFSSSESSTLASSEVREGSGMAESTVESVSEGDISTNVSVVTAETGVVGGKEKISTSNPASMPFTNSDSIAELEYAAISVSSGPTRTISTGISTKEHFEALGLQPRVLIPASKQKCEVNTNLASVSTDTIATGKSTTISKSSLEIGVNTSSVSIGRVDGAITMPSVGGVRSLVIAGALKERTFLASLGRISPEAASVSTSVNASAETASSSAESHSATTSSGISVSTTETAEAYIIPLQNPLELSISEDSVTSHGSSAVSVQETEASVSVTETDTNVKLENE